MTITLIKVDTTLIALEGTVPVGTVMFEKSMNSLYIRQITINEKYKPHDIGTRLVDDLRRRFPEQGLWGEIHTVDDANFWRNWDKSIPTKSPEDWAANYGYFDIGSLNFQMNG